MSEVAAVTNFEALLGDLETLAKAGLDDPTNPEKKDGGGELQKAMKVTLEDGTVVDAEDGTALIKALTDRLDATEGTLGKAMSVAVGLLQSQSKLLKSQSEEIALLKKSVEDLGNKGRGRVSVVSVTERQTPAQTTTKEKDGVSPGEFLAKATDAMRAGRITAFELAHSETLLQKGMQIPDDLGRRVLA